MHKVFETTRILFSRWHDSKPTWIASEHYLNYFLRFTLFRCTYVIDTLHTYEFAKKSIKVGFIFGGNYTTEEMDIRKRNALVRSDTIFLDIVFEKIMELIQDVLLIKSLFLRLWFFVYVFITLMAQTKQGYHLYWIHVSCFQ